MNKTKEKCTCDIRDPLSALCDFCVRSVNPELHNHEKKATETIKYIQPSQKYLESVEILAQGIITAQCTGAFTLQESSLLYNAIENIKHENESNKRKENEFNQEEDNQKKTT